MNSVAPQLRPRHAFVLAAPNSGSGKTTVASLLCLALRARGWEVQPFKLGPDYLDPTHLSRAAGRVARNVDSFLLPPQRVRELFERAATSAEVAVIEGVMGLYDGRDAGSDEHSSADLARLLDVPVVLVIDASGMARTVAAVATGLRDFGEGVKVAGVILNRVGSVRHAEICSKALLQVGMDVLGFVLKDAALELPSRYLGLLSAEQATWDEQGALAAAQHLQLERLLELTAATVKLVSNACTTLSHATPQVRIAYAYDQAFHFYYPDALDELRHWGAELVAFSPLDDAKLPDGVGGLLLGGGYPEAHAQALAANVSMRKSIRAFAERGRPVIGECGGLMYLSQTLTDLHGQVHEMCGVVPYHTRMTSKVRLGYRDAVTLHDSPLAPAGGEIRGHEFHYSELTHEPTQPAYRWQVHGSDVSEGYAAGHILASYLHVHYGGYPELAQRFVKAAQQ